MRIEPWFADEQWISLEQAAVILPRRSDGGTVGASTIRRWAKAGLRGVRLRTFRVGASSATTRQELVRFLAATGCDRG